MSEFDWDALEKARAGATKNWRVTTDPEHGEPSRLVCNQHGNGFDVATFWGGYNAAEHDIAMFLLAPAMADELLRMRAKLEAAEAEPDALMYDLSRIKEHETALVNDLEEARARAAAAYEEAALWLDQEGFDGDHIRALVPDAERDAIARAKANAKEEGFWLGVSCGGAKADIDAKLAAIRGDDT